MKKTLLLAMLLFAIVVQAACATSPTETKKDTNVFWSMLEYNGSKVDRFRRLRCARHPPLKKETRNGAMNTTGLRIFTVLQG